MRRWTCLVFALALVTGGCAKDGGSLVDRVITAYGGNDVVAKVVAVKQTGRIVSPAHPGKVGSVIRGTEGADKLRVETVFADEPPEIRIVSGERGWRNGQETTGPNLDAMVLQAARLALPKLLVDHRSDIRDLGDFESAGHKLHVLELTLGAGKTLTVEIDPTTDLIMRTIGRSEHEGAPIVEFSTEYGEFRKIDGRTFPFYECTTAMGHRTADITFSTMEVSASFPEEVFRP